MIGVLETVLAVVLGVVGSVVGLFICFFVLGFFSEVVDVAVGAGEAVFKVIGELIEVILTDWWDHRRGGRS